MLNRAAVLLRYKAPAVAWINDADPYDREPGMTLDRVNEERTVYLIHEDDVDPPEVLSSWIEQNFLAPFESELEGWYVDESLYQLGWLQTRWGVAGDGMLLYLTKARTGQPRPRSPPS